MKLFQSIRFRIVVACIFFSIIVTACYGWLTFYGASVNSDELFKVEPVNEASFKEVEMALKMKVLEIAKREGVAKAGIGMFTYPNDESAALYTDEKYQVGAAIGWGGAQLKDNVYELSLIHI